MLISILACTSQQLPTARAPTPELADPAVVRFLALGDVGKGNDTQRRVAAGAARTPRGSRPSKNGRAIMAPLPPRKARRLRRGAAETRVTGYLLARRG